MNAIHDEADEVCVPIYEDMQDLGGGNDGKVNKVYFIMIGKAQNPTNRSNKRKVKAGKSANRQYRATIGSDEE